MIKVCMLCPHTKISGGVKVIMTLAHYLQKSGLFQVMIGPRKHNDKLLTWFDYEVNFEIAEFAFDHAHQFGGYDVVINYLDGVLELEKGGPQTKHVLFLQGFGTQKLSRETNNLKYPFDAVIATSSWLLEMAQTMGHVQTYIVPPGIDHKFRKVEIKKPKIPIIGALYHKSPQKNFSLFEAAIQHLILKIKTPVRPLVLTSKKIEREISLMTAAIPTTVIEDPPQLLLPTIYSLCNIWVATSVNEGFGFPPLEAMACGCPVILYPNSGLDGIAINKYNCLFAKNKQEVARHIVTLLTNEALRKSLIDNAFKTVTKFTWERSAKLFSDALMTILQRQ